MHLTATFILFLLGLAVSQAVPTPKIEESLDYNNDNSLNVQDAGEDKERSKKSVIFASSPILASGQAVSFLPQAQTVSIQAAAPAVQTLNIQPALDTVQTLSIQPMVDAIQTLNIQSAAQPLQTFSLQPVPSVQLQALPAVSIQTGAQPYQTVNLIPSQSSLLPQATVISEQVQPLNTVEIVQPAAAVEIAQPARSLDIIQPARALDIVQPARALDIVQPARALDIVQPARALDIVQPARALDNVQPAGALDIAQPARALDIVQTVYPQAALNYVQSMPAVEQVRVLSAPRPMVETITQEEVIQSVRRPTNVVVANEEVMNVAGPITTVYKEQMPLYNEQVIVGPSKAFTLYSEPDMVASYMNGGQVIGYQPQALAALQSGGVIVDTPYMGLRERALMDTVQRTNLIGGRMVERVSTNVYTDAC